MASREVVLVVLRYYPTLSETFVVREIAELQRRGVQVVVAALGERADGAMADGLPDVEVWRPARGLEFAAAALRSGRLNKRRVRLGRWIRKAGRVSRVHVHFAGEAAEWGVAIADALGVPCSVTVHAVDLFKPRPGLGALLRRVQVLTVCDHHQRWIETRYGIRAQVVRCGVEPRDRPLARPEKQPPQVVCVARDVPKKDLDRLVAAVRGLAQLRLIAASPRRSGPDLDVGALRPSEVAQALSGAQLFALPACIANDGDRDGVPVAIMEAMAAGLPIVTRPIAGIPELVDTTVGWIGHDFEHQLGEALAHPGERARRGAAGRARITDDWTQRQSVDALLAAWDTLRR